MIVKSLEYALVPGCSQRRYPQQAPKIRLRFDCIEVLLKERRFVDNNLHSGSSVALTWVARISRRRRKIRNQPVLASAPGSDKHHWSVAPIRGKNRHMPGYIGPSAVFDRAGKYIDGQSGIGLRGNHQSMGCEKTLRPSSRIPAQRGNFLWNSTAKFRSL
jgi:hypothetical protein